MCQMKMFISVYTVFKDIVQIFSIYFSISSFMSSVCMQALRAHVLFSTLTSLHMDSKFRFYPNPNHKNWKLIPFPKP